MYLDVKIRLSNKFWARRLVDTVAMWLKCNSTPPFRVDGRQTGRSSEPVRGAQSRLVLRGRKTEDCGHL